MSEKFWVITDGTQGNSFVFKGDSIVDAKPIGGLQSLGIRIDITHGLTLNLDYVNHTTEQTYKQQYESPIINYIDIRDPESFDRLPEHTKEHFNNKPIKLLDSLVESIDS